MEQVLHWLGYGLCHQLPERSFFGGGIQVPVCARDTGIYLGFAVALIILAVLHRGERPTEVPSAEKSALLGLFVIAMAVDGVTSYAGMRDTTNAIRLATGLGTGFALAAFTLPLVNGELWRRAGRGRVLQGAGRAAVFFGALPVTFLLVLYVAPALGVVYPIAVGASIIATFVSVNLVIASLLPWFERRADRLRDAWAPLVLALAFSLLEIAATAQLKAMLEHAAARIGQ